MAYQFIPYSLVFYTTVLHRIILREQMALDNPPSVFIPKKETPRFQLLTPRHQDLRMSVL
jgi:hypothetical protein